MIMYTKQILYFFVWALLSLHSLSAQSTVFYERDASVQVLASLVFHAQEWEELLKAKTPFSEEEITFSPDEVASLWERAATCCSISFQHNALQNAYQQYEQTKYFIEQGQELKALEALKSTAVLLRLLWEHAIQLEENLSNDLNSSFVLLRSQKDPHVEYNPYIPAIAKKKMTPHLLPLQHEMRSFLDQLCLNTRITADSETFSQAGFKTISLRPRSFIRVASHPQMPDYLVKVYLDTVLKEKRHTPSWQWLVKRCEGANKIRAIIQKRKIKHFVVANKWIYCLPPEPSPPEDPLYTRHFALLVVTDMHLVPQKENYEAWLNQITTEHLDELYFIISRGKGSSYRPDNIAYTYKDTFAFIDTEYPTTSPDFKSIRHFLNSKMRQYWDKLVKNGGF